MKNYIFLLIIIITIVSCQETKKENSDYQEIEVEKLTPGPIVNESLTDKQLDHIRTIHDTFLEVYPISLDETITNFKRDQNPDNEIEVWLAMAESYKNFVLKNKGDDQVEKRKEAFKLVLMRSMMSEEETVKKTEIKILTKKEVKEILDSYQLGKKPIKIETH
ncbi:hypothetical protein [Aquimarina algiphila]|uniref:Uncharacterized protein n=1 Tax=Aquimarina algiphila TaxID=2047982 RepID=A0A554VPR4_9FLAO|nr:hypothetical protein [Aquimarina algiphila]TSE10482.1 hypothetical protein FOF46_04075 [Aquimarina algiphila]